MQDLRTNTKAQAITCWLEETLMSMKESDPRNDTVWVPFSEKTQMYEMYKHDVEVERKYEDLGQTTAASLSYFCRVLTRTYGDTLKMGRKHNHFTKCAYCTNLKAQITKLGPKSEAGKTMRLHYHRHLTWVAMNKQKYYHHRDRAKCFFRQHMSIIMDACDQSNIDVPYLKDHPKDGPMKLSTKMGAVMVHAPSVSGASADKPGGLYLTHIDERVTKGANFWITCLIHVLNQERQKRGGKLPGVLTIQMDSAGDNKNYTMACFCEWLVKTRVFRKVKMCFLPVGHTHEDIDACFGRLSKQFVQYGQDVQCFADMVSQAKKANAHTIDVWCAMVR
jgi:hypothetical protein